MTEITVITKRNYSPFKGLKNNRPSLTIPDQVLGLKIILERHARGMPITGYNPQPVYLEENDQIKSEFDKLDLAEREEILLAHKEKVKQMQRELRAQELAKQKEDLAKESRKEAGEGPGQSQAGPEGKPGAEEPKGPDKSAPTANNKHTPS